MDKIERARLGGVVIRAKYGSKHFRKLGKKGAAKRWGKDKSYSQVAA